MADHRMVSRNGLLIYPQEIREEFSATESLMFRDGRQVTPAEIWQYMTEEAPQRFPYFFSDSPYAISRLSSYVELLSDIKYNYLLLTFRERIMEARKNGVPVVFVQGGQTLEPYYAADTIPLRPFFISFWAQNTSEGLNLRQMDNLGMSLHEQGRSWISPDACHQLTSHAAIKNGAVEVDLIAPYLCTRCSDMAYLAEQHRSTERKTPTYLVDYPLNYQGHKEWAVEYVAQSLRRLVQRLCEIRGKEIGDEHLRSEIRLVNQVRKSAREFVHLWWAAPVPPAYSGMIRKVISTGNDFLGDPVAAKQVIDESCRELKERIDRSTKGSEIADDPVRLFLCGSCINPNPNHIDKVGGVVIGYDDWWSQVSTDVAEEGDPYENLARAVLSLPYERPTEERARWTLEQVRKSGADGVIFSHNWGCNNQSAVARMVCDIVKEAGVPNMVLEQAELGRAEGLEQSRNRVEAFIEMVALNR